MTSIRTNLSSLSALAVLERSLADREALRG